MTLKHLKIFLEVYKTKSITQAGRNLFMSQPAVSLAIREIEDTYGCKLFERISKHLYVTEAGKNLYWYASQMFETYQAMELSMMNYKSVKRIRIGASLTIGTYYLPDIVTTLQEEFPGLKAEVTVNTPTKLELEILNNDLDICVVEGFVHDEHIHHEKLLTDDLQIICSKMNPLAQKERITIDDITKEAFLLREKGSGTREIIDSTFLLHNISISPLWESTLTSALIQGVSRNLGIAIVPRQYLAVQKDAEKIVEIHVEDLLFQRNFYIIYHKEKNLSAVSKRFIALCKSVIQ